MFSKSLKKKEKSDSRARLDIMDRKESGETQPRKDSKMYEAQANVRLVAKPLNGFRDVDGAGCWQFSTISDRYNGERPARLRGATALETPMVESTSVLRAKYGADAHKLIYDLVPFGDRHEPNASLRYDLTVTPIGALSEANGRCDVVVLFAAVPRVSCRITRAQIRDVTASSHSLMWTSLAKPCGEQEAATKK